MNSQTFYKRRIIVSGGITSMDCSPCGRYIVCSGFDEWIRKYHLISQKILIKRDSQHDRVNQIRYSPNGKLIATGSYDKTIIIRKASTLQRIGEAMRGHKDSVRSVAFSPDSQHLASASKDDTIKIWDCQSQEQVGPNIAETDSEFVQYSPNGLWILLGGEGIEIWDSNTRKRIMILTNSITSKAQYSLDGRYIVSSYYNVISLWDVATGKQLGRDLVRHYRGIKSVAFSPDSSLIVSGDNETVRLWNLATGKQISILHEHDEQVGTVQFSKDGNYVILGFEGGTICIIKMKF